MTIEKPRNSSVSPPRQITALKAIILMFTLGALISSGCNGSTNTLDGLSVSSQDINLGDIPPNAVAYGTFKIQNSSLHDAKIVLIEKSCGCVVLDKYENTTIQKGDTKEIKIGLSAFGERAPAKLKQSIKITLVSIGHEQTNKPTETAFVLSIFANLRPLLTVKPSNLILSRPQGPTIASGSIEINRELMSVHDFNELTVSAPKEYGTKIDRITENTSVISVSIQSSDYDSISSAPMAPLVVSSNANPMNTTAVPVSFSGEHQGIRLVPETLVISVDTANPTPQKTLINKKIVVINNDGSQNKKPIISEIKYNHDMISVKNTPKMSGPIISELLITLERMPTLSTGSSQHREKIAVKITEGPKEYTKYIEIIFMPY